MASRFALLLVAAFAAAGCAKRAPITPATVRARLDSAALASWRESRAGVDSDRVPVQLFLAHDPYHCEIVAIFPVDVAEAAVLGADEPAVEDEPLVSASRHDNVVTIQLAPRVYPIQYERYADGVGVVVDWHGSPLVTFTGYLASSDTGYRMNRGDPFIWYHAILFIPYVKHIVLLSQAWVAGLGRTGLDAELRSGDPRLGYRHLVELDQAGWCSISIEPFDEARHDKPRSR